MALIVWISVHSKFYFLAADSQIGFEIICESAANITTASLVLYQAPLIFLLSLLQFLQP